MLVLLSWLCGCWVVAACGLLVAGLMPPGLVAAAREWYYAGSACELVWGEVCGCDQ